MGITPVVDVGPWIIAVIVLLLPVVFAVALLVAVIVTGVIISIIEIFQMIFIHPKVKRNLKNIPKWTKIEKWKNESRNISYNRCALCFKKFDNTKGIEINDCKEQCRHLFGDCICEKCYWQAERKSKLKKKGIRWLK